MNSLLKKLGVDDQRRVQIGPIKVKLNFDAWRLISLDLYHPFSVHRASYARNLKELTPKNHTYQPYDDGLIGMDFGGRTIVDGKVHGKFLASTDGKIIAIQVASPDFQMTTVVYTSIDESGLLDISVDVYRDKEPWAKKSQATLNLIWVIISFQVLLEDVFYLQKHQDWYLSQYQNGGFDPNRMQKRIIPHLFQS